MNTVTSSNLALLFRSASYGCTLPAAVVYATMRPLPIEPLAGVPPYIQGVSIIRGIPTPVVDLALLLSGRDHSPVTRFILIKTGDRAAALAVESVAGVARLDDSQLNELPPLLRNPEMNAVGSIGALDERLLLALTAGRIVPEEVWGLLAVREAGR